MGMGHGGMGMLRTDDVPPISPDLGSVGAREALHAAYRLFAARFRC